MLPNMAPRGGNGRDYRTPASNIMQFRSVNLLPNPQYEFPSRSYAANRNWNMYSNRNVLYNPPLNPYNNNNYGGNMAPDVSVLAQAENTNMYVPNGANQQQFSNYDYSIDRNNEGADGTNAAIKRTQSTYSVFEGVERYENTGRESERSKVGRKRASKDEYNYGDDALDEKRKNRRAKHDNEQKRSTNFDRAGHRRSIVEKGSSDSVNDVESNSESEGPEKPSVRDQFLATFQRRMLQRRSKWLDLLFEFLVPVIIVVITVLLWTAFGYDQSTLTDSYVVNLTALPPGAIPDENPNLIRDMYKIFMCYNKSYIADGTSSDASLPDEYSGISSCDELMAMGVSFENFLNYTPFPEYDYDFLQYSYLNDKFDVDDPENQKKYPIHEGKIPLRGLNVNADTFLFFYMTGSMGKLSRMGTLDNTIAALWAYSYSSSNRSVIDSVLSASGYTVNNRFSAIQAHGNIGFAPRANIPDDMIDYFYNKSKLFKYVFSRKHLLYDTIEDALADVESHKFGRTMAVIEIQQMDLNGLKLKLHVNNTAVPSFDENVRRNFNGGFDNDRAEMYYVNGVAALQEMIYQYYLENSALSGVSYSAPPVNFDYFTGQPPVDPTTAPSDGSSSSGSQSEESSSSKEGSSVSQSSKSSSSVESSSSSASNASQDSQGQSDSETINTLKESRASTGLPRMYSFTTLMTSMFGAGKKVSTMLTYGPNIIAFVVVLSFMYPVTTMTKALAAEKEMRITEAVKVMGLRPYNNYLAWYLEGFLFYFLLAFVITILICATYCSRSDAFLFFLMFFIYGLTLLSLSALVGACFSSARIASLTAPIVYTLLTVPYFAMQTPVPSAVLGFSIFSPSAFGALLTMMFRWELGEGFSANKLNSPIDDPRTLYLLIFLLADLVLYTLLMLYLDAVVPKQWGTPKHPLFFILEPIKCCRKRCGCCKKDDQETDDDDTDEVQDGRDPEGVYEEETIPAGERSLDVQGLRKVFKRSGKEFVAVNDFCWMMPTGGISVLLGHNGAGKSTLMNMITGMTTCDGGDCRIVGYSIHDDLSMTRQKLGFCPQHNILWPDLTCRDHLEFYAKIKGVKGAKLEEAVQRILEAVDLVDKADYPSRALSGGQKRKLSVAVAFVGGSPLVLLDEPTAGMDVAARRHTWELLLKLSEDTSVLLTTHFMDEADLLGDRIAIMSAGRLMCSGSSLFLKSRLGVGYNITFAVTPETETKKLTRFVQAYIPRAGSVADTGCEISYSLLKEDANLFSDLLSAVEAEGEDIGICGYVLSATTLEEVFLQVVKKTLDEQAMATLRSKASNLSAQNIADMRKNTRTVTGQGGIWDCEMLDGGCKLYWMQFKVMMKKRFHNGVRDYKNLCFQIICPVLFVILAMLLSLIKLKNSTELTLNYGDYVTDMEQLTTGCEAYFESFVADEVSPSNVAVVSYTDKLLGNFDMFNYLMDTAETHTTPRYAAFSCDGSVVSSQLASLYDVTNPLTIFYNTSTNHEVPFALSAVYDYALQTVRGAGTCSISTSLETLPLTELEKSYGFTIQNFLIACLIMLPLTFLPSNYISWIVYEKECKSRHLQNIAGLRYLVYWIANYVYDFVCFFITGALFIVIFVIFQKKPLISYASIGATIVLILLYGLSCIPFSYLLSFLYSDHGSAQTSVLAFGFLTGLVLNIVVFVLTMMLDTASDTASTLRYIFRIFPTFSIGEGLTNLLLLKENQLQTPTLTPWSLDVTAWPIIYMAIETPVFFAATLLLDHPRISTALKSFSLYKLFCCRFSCCPSSCCCSGKGHKSGGTYDDSDELKDVDSDVEEEEREVLKRYNSKYVVSAEQASINAESMLSRSTSIASAIYSDESSATQKNFIPSNDAITVVHLNKVFNQGRKREKVAVKDLTFGIVPGEVFGLLGTNGAGKTTTISILCQELLPTAGEVNICGYDMAEEGREAMQCVGYCPQFDATLNLLTVEEHLRVFAGIRGIVPAQQETVINELIALCGLEAYRKVTSSALSGGNRRKLSFALSLVGGPPVVLLDEPSAGMDPVARRGLWTAIQGVSRRCSVLLTTHHLEEIEALADCVAMMVAGELRCIGSKTHLKTKFGTGFELSLRMRSGLEAAADYEENKQLVIEFMQTRFPEATLNEMRGQRCVYALPPDVRLPEVFLALQQEKERIQVEDYCISQTSIEQVFMRISEEAEKKQSAAR